MRKKLLHRVADAIEDNADDIAVLECIDTGQAHRFMAKAAIRAAENFRFFADKCAEARDGLNTPSEEHWNILTRVPIGPVGVITPWKRRSCCRPGRSPLLWLPAAPSCTSRRNGRP